MATCGNNPAPLLTNEHLNTSSLSRQCTEDQTVAIVTLSTTPLRVCLSVSWVQVDFVFGITSSNLSSYPPYKQDKESKRRRLTSESAGSFVFRAAGPHLPSHVSSAAAEAALGAVLGCTDPDALIRQYLYAWSHQLKRLQPKVGSLFAL